MLKTTNNKLSKYSHTIKLKDSYHLCQEFKVVGLRNCSDIGVKENPRITKEKKGLEFLPLVIESFYSSDELR